MTSPLNGVERGRILSLEEPSRGNHRTGERGHPLEALAEVEPRGRVLGASKDGDVRVRGDLETGEAAS